MNGASPERKMCLVIHDLPAYELQSSDDYDPGNPRVILKGAFISAVLEKQQWAGQEVAKFMVNSSWYYASWKTFQESTQPTQQF